MLTAARISAGLSIAHAHILGRVDATGSTVSAPQTAIAARSLNVEQGFDLVDTHLSSTLDIEGAEIGKGFRAEGLEVNSGTTAITAGWITIAGSWDLARSKLVGAMNFP
ncbi:MAG: hypothetical protein ACERJ2_11835 [Filomicrobium sp.]